MTASTGQTHLLIETDTGRIVSTHPSREAALFRLLCSHPLRGLSVVPNPNTSGR